jgi:hypothetical protein
MKQAESILHGNPFVRASYGLLLASLAVGAITAPFNLKVAILPSMLVFGWSQIGGL